MTMQVPRSTTPIRLVLVDDSPTIRTMLAALFNEVPEIEVCALAEDGLHAVDVVLTERPDVVVMDMQMPEMNGLDAAREILTVWSDARIVMNTAYGDEALMREAQALGIAGYVTKDQRPSKLIRTILSLATAPRELLT